MNLNHYELDTTSDFLSFEFFSEGPKGTIKKVIQFTKITSPDTQHDIYNLAFGDYNESKDRIDDLIVSDNKDTEKILMTVATAVFLFTDDHPNVLIFARGSTPPRTRYYTMGIAKHLPIISQAFEIWGALPNKEWEPFRKNQPYKALLARRKN